MSNTKAQSRLSNLLSHFAPSSASPTVADNSKEFEHRFNFHSLSPTYWLPRAAAIEPEVCLPLSRIDMVILIQCAGRSNLPCHSQQQDLTEKLWRIRGPE